MNKEFKLVFQKYITHLWPENLHKYICCWKKVFFVFGVILAFLIPSCFMQD